MLYCTSYTLAVIFCVLTMFCWGSWGSAQKLAGADYPYKRFYWDLVTGMLVFATITGFTAGSVGTSEWNFITNLKSASRANVGYAMLGGLIFNASMILLVKAIDMAGLSVAFPVTNGISIALGTTVNYIILPKGNAKLIFTGVTLITLAVIANAFAGKLKGGNEPKSGGKGGLLVAILSGIVMSFFFSFVVRTIDKNFTAAAPQPGMLSPYSAFFLFVLGTWLSTFVLNPLPPKKLFAGGFRHGAGFLGAAVWALGSAVNYVAAGPAGAAIAFGLGQGATLISAVWGIFIWKEFKGAPKVCGYLNAAFAILFITGLAVLVKAGA